MSKMSKLWYEARDAIETETYLKTRTCILREYLAELSIVQPWESEQAAWKVVDKKHNMIGKLKKEIERRRKRNLARAGKIAFAILTGTIAAILAVLFLRQFFPEQTQPTKTTEQTQVNKPLESSIQNQSNRTSEKSEQPKLRQ